MAIYHLKEIRPGVTTVLKVLNKITCNGAMSDAVKSSVSNTNYKSKCVMTYILLLFLLVYNGNLSEISTLMMGCRNERSKNTMVLNDG